MKIQQLIFNLLFTICGWISSAIALWRIWCTESITPVFFGFCLVIAIVSILYIVGELWLYCRECKKVFVHSRIEQVNNYLYEWIKSGGRTVVFTRDFTWANCDAKMRTMLEEKSRNHELIVCLCQATPVTDRLKQLGAEVYIHNLHDLKSRFTIIHYGTNCPQITLGSRNPDGSYVNKRYSMQYDPHIYNLFVELFESTKATCKL